MKPLRELLAGIRRAFQPATGSQTPDRVSPWPAPSPGLVPAGPERAETPSDPQQVTLELFTYLRRAGFALGVGELLAALQAIDGGWGGESSEALKQVIVLLWCNSAAEYREFDVVWEKVCAVLASPGGTEPPPEPPIPPPLPKHRKRPGEQPLPPPPEIPWPALAARQAPPEWGTLPVRAPFSPALLEGMPDLRAYTPVSRRFLAYAWRYLRRPVADGPEEILDVEATVERAAEQGFYLAPVYRRCERNHAHLAIFLDQGGSMVPFHRFTRDVVETARYESTIEQVDVFYFHDVPADYVYLDPHQTSPVELDWVLAGCSEDTGLLVVSDAGAARGHQKVKVENKLKRIRATAGFLARLRKASALIAWLNPMPDDRWPGTSAEVIFDLVPMFQMDHDGFSNTVDVLRGQPLSPIHL